MDLSVSHRKKITCLFSAVEADPFVKVGGLGDVAYALPYALRNLHPEEIDNHEVDIRLVIPCHAFSCDFSEPSVDKVTFDVRTNLGDIPTTAYLTEINGLPIYIISSRLIPQDASVYSTDNYMDGLKFLFFSQATLALCKRLDWQPDVIHVNDWHTAITPHLLHLEKNNGHFEQTTRTVLTIHNLPYLGTGTEEAIKDLGIPYTSSRALPAWARKLPLPIGLSASDKIVAVSPTYANEILTPEFGCGLSDYLSTRKDALSGIINGIDVQQWNPATDNHILAKYSINNLYERQNNKHALQNQLNLHINPDIPLLAFIGRMNHQKGVDLIIDGLRLLKDTAWQAIILGTGETRFEKQAIQLETEFPDNVRAIMKYDSKLSRRIYAGADILLMPSRYEPCGLAQMIAMRYGCIPLARATGGLKDTISDINDSINATGFLFEEESGLALAETVRDALEIFQNKPRWHIMQTNAMQKDFSWHQSALKYTRIYMGL